MTILDRVIIVFLLLKVLWTRGSGGKLVGFSVSRDVGERWIGV